MWKRGVCYEIEDEREGRILLVGVVKMTMTLKRIKRKKINPEKILNFIWTPVKLILTTDIKCYLTVEQWIILFTFSRGQLFFKQSCLKRRRAQEVCSHQIPDKKICTDHFPLFDTFLALYSFRLPVQYRVTSFDAVTWRMFTWRESREPSKFEKKQSLLSAWYN